MFKITVILLISTLIWGANSFCCTSSDGKRVVTKSIKHKQNAHIYQDLKVYSYQAFQAEIQQQKLIAMQNGMDMEAYKKMLALNKKSNEKQTEHNGLIKDAKQYKGGKYVWGGTRPSGFDCSGYTQYLYGKHGIKLPRTAYAQSRMGKTIAKKDLRQGDLLFFLTDKSRGVPVTHVGIYAGNDEFIHAASKDKGIIISPLSTGSYARCFVCAKRVAS